MANKVNLFKNLIDKQDIKGLISLCRRLHNKDIKFKCNECKNCENNKEYEFDMDILDDPEYIVKPDLSFYLGKNTYKELDFILTHIIYNIDRLKIYQKKHDNRILKKHIDNYYDYSTLIPLKKYSREQFESKAFAIEYNEYYKYMKKSQERLSLIIDKNIRWEGASGQEICYMRFEKY